MYTNLDLWITNYFNSGTSTPKSGLDSRGYTYVAYKNNGNRTATINIKQYRQFNNTTSISRSVSATNKLSLNGGSYNTNTGTGNIAGASSGTTILIKDQYFTLPYDDNGNLSFNVYIAMTTTLTSSGSTSSRNVSANYSLPNIGTNKTLFFNISNIGLNSFILNWSSNTNVTNMNYILQGVSDWVYLPASGTSGSISVTGLNINTYYTIQLAGSNNNNASFWYSGTIGTTTKNKGLEVSAIDFTDETNPQMVYWKPSGYDINLRLEQNVNGTYVNRITRLISGTATDEVNTTYTFELTDEERNLLRQNCSGNSIPIRYVTATLINGTETYFDYTVNDKVMTLVNANPTFTNYTYKDVDTTCVALTGNNQKLIKGKSNLQTIISVANKMTPLKYATAIKYRTNCGTKSSEVNYSSNNEVSMNIENVDSGIIYVSAIDSRGNSTQITKTASIVDYSKPIISSVEFERQNGIGTTCNIKINGTYTNVNFGAFNNTITKVEYSVDNGTNWVDITNKVQYSNGTFTNVDNASIGTFTVGTEYNGILKVYDGNGINILDSASSTFKINSGEPLFDINKTKKGVGIGLISNKKGCNIDGDYYINGSNLFNVDILDSNKSIYDLAKNELKFTQQIYTRNSVQGFAAATVSNVLFTNVSDISNEILTLSDNKIKISNRVKYLNISIALMFNDKAFNSYLTYANTYQNIQLNERYDSCYWTQNLSLVGSGEENIITLAIYPGAYIEMSNDIYWSRVIVSAIYI